MTKSYIVTLLATVIVVSGAIAQVERKTLPGNCRVEDVSPNSQLISCVERTGSYPYRNTLMILSSKSLRLRFKKDYGTHFPYSAVFLGENTILVRTDTTFTPVFVKGKGDGELFPTLKQVAGILLKVDLKDSLIYFSTVFPDDEVRICQLDMKDRRIDTLSVDRAQASFSDFAVFSKDSVVLAFQDHFYLLSFARHSISELLDSRGRTLHDDGGTVSLTPDHKALVYSFEGKLLVYTLSTKKVTPVMDLHGYSSPILSPDGSFLVLSKTGDDGQVLTEMLFNPRVSSR